MKKAFEVAAAAVLLAVPTAGCGGGEDAATNTSNYSTNEVFTENDTLTVDDLNATDAVDNAAMANANGYDASGEEAEPVERNKSRKRP